jgi:enoyl-CoA hydratase
MSAYDAYTTLRFAHPHPGVLEIVLDNPPVNTVGIDGHRHLTEVWLDVARDRDVRAVLLRAEGRAFSAGGDFDCSTTSWEDHANAARVMREAGELVRNIVECPQPIVSAINGVAVGAGLAAALLADIPIAGRSARLLDGHVTIGVAAGDHAVVLWPLLIGMAKAKYHLLTNDPIDGTEAERLGLVARWWTTTSSRGESRRRREAGGGEPDGHPMDQTILNHWLRAPRPRSTPRWRWSSSAGWERRPRRVSAAREKRPPVRSVDEPEPGLESV